MQAVVTARFIYIWVFNMTINTTGAVVRPTKPHDQCVPSCLAVRRHRGTARNADGDVDEHISS